MKMLLIFAAVLVAGMVGFHTILSNGMFIKYLDTHPNPKMVPPVEFFVGEGYYIMGHLEQSATYYLRIAERYPKSTYADDAYYNYLVALDDMNTPRQAMASLYETYLEKFPEGAHVQITRRKIEFCRNAR